MAFPATAPAATPSTTPSTAAPASKTTAKRRRLSTSLLEAVTVIVVVIVSGEILRVEEGLPKSGIVNGSLHSGIFGLRWLSPDLQEESREAGNEEQSLQIRGSLCKEVNQNHLIRCAIKTFEISMNIVSFTSQKFV